MSLKKVDVIGTGNMYALASTEVMLELNNTPITSGEAYAFMWWLGKHYTVTFSNRKCKHRWGTAWPRSRRAIIYRHSVHVFLHELAHLTGPHCDHGKEFGKELGRLIKKWKQFNGVKP